MKPTNFKCCMILDGFELEKVIYSDSEGDLFIHHYGRFFDFDTFTSGRNVTVLREMVAV